MQNIYIRLFLHLSYKLKAYFQHPNFYWEHVQHSLRAWQTSQLIRKAYTVNDKSHKMQTMSALQQKKIKNISASCAESEK